MDQIGRSAKRLKGATESIPLKAGERASSLDYCLSRSQSNPSRLERGKSESTRYCIALLVHVILFGAAICSISIVIISTSVDRPFGRYLLGFGSLTFSILHNSKF